MNNNNTKLVNALLKGEDILEIFGAEVEKAINTVLEAELTLWKEEYNSHI